MACFIYLSKVFDYFFLSKTSFYSGVVSFCLQAQIGIERFSCNLFFHVPHDLIVGIEVGFTGLNLESGISCAMPQRLRSPGLAIKC